MLAKMTPSATMTDVWFTRRSVVPLGRIPDAGAVSPPGWRNNRRMPTAPLPSVNPAATDWQVPNDGGLSVNTIAAGDTAPDLRPCFPHAQPIDADKRAPAGHETLCDPTFFAGCGYMTPEEASLLYRIARASPPGWWVEIGTHTGWSLAHIMAAGRDAVGLDPEYARVSHNETRSPDAFLKRASENLQRVRDAAPDAGRFSLLGITSTEFFADPQLRPYGPSPVGVIIDGDHSDPHPVADALGTVRTFRPAIVILHDAMIHSVQRGAFALQRMGYRTHTYRTAQLLVVAWLDPSWTPPAHEPDKAFDFATWMASRRLKFVPWSWPVGGQKPEQYSAWDRAVNSVKLSLRTGKFRRPKGH